MNIMNIAPEKSSNAKANSYMLDISSHTWFCKECKLHIHLTQCFEVFHFMVFHLQDVKQTYTIVQQTFELPNIQTWFSATFRYCTNYYSPIMLFIS
jgi:hypothetical protein